MGQKKSSPWQRLLFWRHRPDGRLIQHRDPLQQMMPYLMPSRNGSCAYFRQQLNLTRALEYIHANNADPDREKISVFTLFLTAIVRTFALKPRLNRFIVGRRMFTRNRIQLSYVVKREMSEQGGEIGVKQTFGPRDTIWDVSRRATATIGQARQGQGADSVGLIRTILRFPGFIVSLIVSLARTLNTIGLLPAALTDSDPLFSSVFISNVGSIDIDAPYHHLYEWGTISLFVVIGKYRRVELHRSDGTTDGKYVVDLTFTIDERITDGYYFAQALKVFQDLVEHPEQLETPPENVVADE